MIDFHNRDWVNHIIIAIGAIVGVFILIGFVSSIFAYFSTQNTNTSPSSTSPVLVTSSTVSQALTVADINKTITYSVGSQVVITLPESQYPHANFLLFQNADGVIGVSQQPTLTTGGNWTTILAPLKAGQADVIVKSSQAGLSDFHVTLTIQ